MQPIHPCRLHQDVTRRKLVGWSNAPGVYLKTYARCVSVAPEAFDSDRLRNLTRGEWRRIGFPGDHVNPVDGTPIPGPPRVDYDEVVESVRFACGEHAKWSQVDLDERRPGLPRRWTLWPSRGTCLRSC
jgi:hypothetical protein